MRSTVPSKYFAHHTLDDNSCIICNPLRILFLIVYPSTCCSGTYTASSARCGASSLVTAIRHAYGSPPLCCLRCPFSPGSSFSFLTDTWTDSSPSDQTLRQSNALPLGHKTLLSPTRLQQPQRNSHFKILQLAATETFSTTYHLLLNATPEQKQLLFEIPLNNPASSHPTQLPHRKSLVVLPLCEEESSKRPRESSFVSGIFKPP